MELMTTTEVAAFAGTPPDAIGQMITKGFVTPAGPSSKGGRHAQNKFTRDQAERIKRYYDALRAVRQARKDLR